MLLQKILKGLNDFKFHLIVNVFNLRPLAHNFHHIYYTKHFHEYLSNTSQKAFIFAAAIVVNT